MYKIINQDSKSVPQDNKQAVPPIKFAPGTGFIKALRLDEYSNGTDFLSSLPLAGISETLRRDPVREGGKRVFTAREPGVIINRYKRQYEQAKYGHSKAAAFTKAEKAGASKSEAVSFYSVKHHLPFFHAQHKQLVGVKDLGSLPFQRAYLNKMGSIERPYDSDHKAFAQGFDAKFTDRRLDWQALQSISDTVDPDSPQLIEILARVFWDFNKSSICVLKDNFASRCAAYGFADFLQHRLDKLPTSAKLPTNYKVPISYYYLKNRQVTTGMLSPETRAADKLLAKHLIADLALTTKLVRQGKAEFLLALEASDLLPELFRGKLGEELLRRNFYIFDLLLAKYNSVADKPLSRADIPSCWWGGSSRNFIEYLVTPTGEEVKESRVPLNCNGIYTQDLSGMDLRGLHLANKVFADSNLRGAQLPAQLGDAIFANCDLRDSNLDFTQFADFKKIRDHIGWQYHKSFSSSCRKFHLEASHPGNVKIIFTDGPAFIIGRDKAGKPQCKAHTFPPEMLELFKDKDVTNPRCGSGGFCQHEGNYDAFYNFFMYLKKHELHHIKLPQRFKYDNIITKKQLQVVLDNPNLQATGFDLTRITDLHALTDKQLLEVMEHDNAIYYGPELLASIKGRALVLGSPKVITKFLISALHSEEQSFLELVYEMFDVQKVSMDESVCAAVAGVKSDAIQTNVFTQLVLPNIIQAKPTSSLFSSSGKSCHVQVRLAELAAQFGNTVLMAKLGPLSAKTLDQGLRLAVMNNQRGMIEYLLKRKANVNTKDDKGETLAHLCVRHGQVQLLPWLHKQGVSINAKCNEGNTAAMLAAACGDMAAVKALFHCGADFTMHNKQGATPFYIALAYDNYAIARFMIKQGLLDVNCLTKDGESVLHYAAKWGLEETVQALLSRQAKVDVLDKQGNTPLHIAIAENQTEVAKRLIKSGARLNVRNKQGLTALQLSQNINKVYWHRRVEPHSGDALTDVRDLADKHQDKLPLVVSFCIVPCRYFIVGKAVDNTLVIREVTAEHGDLLSRVFSENTNYYGCDTFYTLRKKLQPLLAIIAESNLHHTGHEAAWQYLQYAYQTYQVRCSEQQLIGFADALIGFLQKNLTQLNPQTRIQARAMQDWVLNQCKQLPPATGWGRWLQTDYHAKYQRAFAAFEQAKPVEAKAARVACRP